MVSKERASMEFGVRHGLVGECIGSNVKRQTFKRLASNTAVKTNPRVLFHVAVVKRVEAKSIRSVQLQVPCIMLAFRPKPSYNYNLASGLDNPHQKSTLLVPQVRWHTPIARPINLPILGSIQNRLLPASHVFLIIKLDTPDNKLAHQLQPRNK